MGNPSSIIHCVRSLDYTDCKHALSFNTPRNTNFVLVKTLKTLPKNNPQTNGSLCYFITKNLRLVLGIYSSKRRIIPNMTNVHVYISSDLSAPGVQYHNRRPTVGFTTHHKTLLGRVESKKILVFEILRTIPMLNIITHHTSHSSWMLGRDVA